MVFHRAKHKIYKITIKPNSNIQQVDHIKFLGVVIDTKLQ